LKTTTAANTLNEHSYIYKATRLLIFIEKKMESAIRNEYHVSVIKRISKIKRNKKPMKVRNYFW